MILHFTNLVPHRDIFCPSECYIYSFYYKKLVHVIMKTEKSKICSWQTGDPQVLDLKAWLSGELISKFQSKCESKRRLMYSLRVVRQAERILSYSVSYFNQAFKALHEAYLYWGGQSSLLRLLIPMLISHKNTFIPRIMFNHTWPNLIDR